MRRPTAHFFAAILLSALGQPLIPEMKIDAERKPTMKDGWAPVGVGLGMGN
ncbi:MAG: hypothetical protein Q7W05_01730 [Deltaproteobacteria bacterium]|nr:hypothetical protein [Deltaproteobacteria bacterium]